MGTHAGPYELADWGGSTYNPETGVLYLHIMKKEWDGILNLPRLNCEISKSYVLTGGEAEITNSDKGLSIYMRKAADIHPFDTIIVLYCKNYRELSDY